MSDLKVVITFLFLSLTLAATSWAQVPVDKTAFDSGVVKVDQNGELLYISWPAGNEKNGQLILNLDGGSPLFKHILLGEKGAYKEIATDINPQFILTIGKRNLDRNGWMVFFDNPADRDNESYISTLEKKNVHIVSEGSRTHIIIGEISAGNFKGDINLTLFNGSPLMNIAANMSTSVDSTAIIYDAGLVSSKTPWKKIFWTDPQDYTRDAEATDNHESQNVAVKYRTIAGQGKEGGIAVFPPPHQYFYPLDNAYNEKHTWFGRNYRDLVPGYGLGIRHNLLGDRRWVPWFNAPPNTKQKLNFFCLLSAEQDGKVIEEVKKFTRSDTYNPLDGFYTMSTHFHQEHTYDILTHKKVSPMPGFVKAFRKTGVNIVHLAEFHGPGNPNGPDVKRFSELQTLFEECERLSNGNFLLLPGEEPNHFFGGHWINLFSKPVYWVMSREEDQPFAEVDKQYGEVYHVNNETEMLRLLKKENGLAWTAHPRIKGSIGYPDKYKNEEFYQSEHFLGAAWKALPADLSHAELGKRALDLMSDMANWGQEKYMLGEADLFKILPSYELYGHLNVNYVQLDKLPDFEDGWSTIIESLQNGKFFVSTGEVLLPDFTVNGREAGEYLKLSENGNAKIHLDAQWTFPLNYLEIISGDGEKVFKKKISLKDTEALGNKTFNLSVNLKGRKWVRVEVWDTAANGAFTQSVWLD